ncbi:hypothetical protein CKAH01_04346 [Colletotrichum kahawae]|uniref:Uncharacterized protein n=1 Tax=Colletotrichum kahawae TaxID=34407 RepID=A0AAD9YK11_COLKA|nr:hypothetical protein CKAH01_04346 [Colletotrichum kahawae]
MGEGECNSLLKGETREWDAEGATARGSRTRFIQPTAQDMPSTTKHEGGDSGKGRLVVRSGRVWWTALR